MPDPLAVATVVLALFTGWLALEARWSRKQDKHEKQRLAFRAALFEQLDNCRLWLSHPPDRGVAMLEYMQGRAPKFEAVEALLGAVDLPSDLAAYVVWLVAETRDVHGQFDKRLTPPIIADDLLRPDKFRDEWWVLVDRIQVLASLLQVAAEKRGLRGVLPPNSRWLRPLPGPAEGRTLTEANDLAMRGAPPWPAGFEKAKPAKRDHEGAALAAQQHAQLADSLGQALHR